MEKKNLFSAVKTFINNTPVGQTFTTKQPILSNTNLQVIFETSRFSLNQKTR